MSLCRNPNFGLATEAKGLQGYRPRGNPGVKAKRSQGCEPRRSPGVTSHTLGSVRECEGVWGSEPSHSQGNSHFVRWNPSGFLKFQRVISGAKTQWLVVFFISLESSWNVTFKMGLHCSFGHLKHKLWSKKGRESNCKFDSRPEKVKNWPELLGYKGRATYLWKAFDKSYNFASNHISIQGLFAKLCGSKVMGVPTNANLGISGKKSHLDVGSVANHKV